ncbi:MAG: hypothetical protein RMZ42_22040 [Nostoc sp. DedQUE05]|uniref:hypothetical protein n=1 Tax=Nostoc sp. DedQUE05 TaxID=3075391 RepID=UPI002AD249C8|nr:hypothetical protein [Nostoc sp. DedQUE05]MDZ8094588.1 hypothetical protein [Nostoc sp. DedQUE05]
MDACDRLRRGVAHCHFFTAHHQNLCDCKRSLRNTESAIACFNQCDRPRSF